MALMTERAEWLAQVLRRGCDGYRASKRRDKARPSRGQSQRTETEGENGERSDGVGTGREKRANESWTTYNRTRKLPRLYAHG